MAARGEVEAQGRGSLHPHVLLWVHLLSLQELLDRVLRDPAELQARLRKWMFHVFEAVQSVQQSSVEAMGSSLQAVPTQRVSDKPWVVPLPLGPNEQRHFRADSRREMAKAEEVGGEAGSEDRPLFFHRPDAAEDAAWPEARRAELPLRNNSGDVVDKAEWDAEFAASSKTFWTSPISASAAGALPTYTLPPELSGEELGQLSEEVIQELRAAVPSDAGIGDWFTDVREPIIGAAIHVCSPPCWKYRSKEGNTSAAMAFTTSWLSPTRMATRCASAGGARRCAVTSRSCETLASQWLGAS